MLSVDEARRELGVSPARVHQLINEGKLAATPGRPGPGGGYRISRSALEEYKRSRARWLEEQRRRVESSQ